ncbi:hybrid signal transduction histidine kinase M, partial [Tanacetum coccineum]
MTTTSAERYSSRREETRCGGSSTVASEGVEAANNELTERHKTLATLLISRKQGLIRNFVWELNSVRIEPFVIAETFGRQSVRGHVLDSDIGSFTSSLERHGFSYSKLVSEGALLFASDLHQVYSIGHMSVLEGSSLYHNEETNTIGSVGVLTKGGTPPPTPVLLLSDKLMTLTNITSIVPTKLDIDEMNYSSWLYFFKHLVKGYGLMDHLVGPKVVDGMDEASVSTPPQDPKWLKLDTIVLSWIFITCSKTLQGRLVDNDPQTAKEAWDLLESIFTDNKRSRAVTLKADLRALTLGDMSIDAYFRKIESTATLLARLGAPISNDDLVSYELAGLPEKYDGVSLLIAHREPFPDLKTVCSMLTTEEMRLKSRPHTTFVDGSSSSPLALMTKSGSS